MSAVLTLLAALAGAVLFEFLRVPAGALIGAVVGVAALNTSPIAAVALPAHARFATFAALGWLIGQGVTRDTLLSLASNSRLIGVVVVLLLGFSGALAFSLVKLGGFDAATAFLATSPGGLSQMTALSAAVGADGAVVATLHVARVLTVVALSPVVLKFLPDA